MSRNYDNWERLVAAVLKRDQLWQLFHAQSRSPSLSSESSSLSFSFGLGSSIEDAPCSSPEWSAANHGERDAETGSSRARVHIGYQPQSPVDNLSPNKSEASKPFWKRALKIELPKLRVYQHGNFSPKDSLDGPKTSRRMPSSTLASRDHCAAVTPLHPRAGKQHSESSVNWPDSAKQESYPLPLPPAAMSKTSPVSNRSSSETSPSAPHTPERVENSKLSGTNWKKGRFLGRSAIAEVYAGFCSEKGVMCALKEFRLSFAKSKQSVRAMEKEIALLSGLSHPNIVQYYGSEMVGDRLYLYYEYMSGGSVHKLLKQYGKFGESAIRSYLRQILSGLAYLHSRNIAHGDIKGDHILVSPSGIVKLSSFAIEKHLTRESNSSLIIDSPYWTAPEVIMNSYVRNPPMDIWSLGCAVVEMATSRPPMSHYNEILAMFKISNNKELPAIPDYLSSEGKDFLRQCFQWNPLHRATASQLLEHTFVRANLRTVTTRSPLPTPTIYARQEVNTHETSIRQLGLGRHAIHSSRSSKSNHHYIPHLSSNTNVHTPKSYISAPVSPVGSPLPHPNSPRGQMYPPLISSPPTASTSSTPPTGGIGAIPHPLGTRSTSPQDTVRKKSPGINSPSYWDPNILRGLHSGTHAIQEMGPSNKDAIEIHFRRTANEQSVLDVGVSQHLLRVPTKSNSYLV